MAKHAMSTLKRFDVADQSLFYQNYYGRLAWRFEPLQLCADETRRTFEAALSLGQVDTAFLSAVHSIKSLIFSGARLKSTLKEIDYYLHLLETYKSEVAKNFLLIYRETVCLLIGNGKTTSIESASSVGDLNDTGNKLRESDLFHKAIQCYWIGHVQRCRYYIGKSAPMLASLAQLTTFMSKFYHGKTIDMSTEYETDISEVFSTQLFCFQLAYLIFRTELTRFSRKEEKFNRRQPGSS